MNDEELIKKIAKLWVDNDGDVDGILYCLEKIKNKIEQLLKLKELNDTLS